MPFRHPAQGFAYPTAVCISHALKTCPLKCGPDNFAPIGVCLSGSFGVYGENATRPERRKGVSVARLDMVRATDVSDKPRRLQFFSGTPLEIFLFHLFQFAVALECIQHGIDFVQQCRRIAPHRNHIIFARERRADHAQIFGIGICALKIN